MSECGPCLGLIMIIDFNQGRLRDYSPSNLRARAYKARACGSVDNASKTGMLNASVFPEAVGVVITIFSPFLARFTASA